MALSAFRRHEVNELQLQATDRTPKISMTLASRHVQRVGTNRRVIHLNKDVDEDQYMRATQQFWFCEVVDAAPRSV